MITNSENTSTKQYIPSQKVRYQRTQTGSSGPRDKFIAAKPPGWRLSAAGNWYFERRKNRSDTDEEWKEAIKLNPASKGKVLELTRKSTKILDESAKGTFTRDAAGKKWDLYVRYENFPAQVGLSTETVAERITNLIRTHGHSNIKFFNGEEMIGEYPDEIKEPDLRFIFKEGSVYSDDHYGLKFKVISRTDKTVTLENLKQNTQKKYLITVKNGEERATYLSGKYPVYIHATHLKAEPIPSNPASQKTKPTQEPKTTTPPTQTTPPQTPPALVTGLNPIGMMLPNTQTPAAQKETDLPAIDEKMARLAKELNSFSDYIEGSATATFRNEVANAREKVEEHKKKVDSDYHAKIDSMFQAYINRLAALTNEYYRIEASCPSVMITGGSNFPVKKKQKQNARRDSWREEANNLEAYLNKILSVGFGGISSDDKDAEAKLQKKLDSLVKLQEDMKTVNAWVRKYKTLNGCPVSDELLKEARSMQEYYARGYSFNTSVEFRQNPDEIQPFQYSLTNNNAEINRLKKRIEEIQKMKAAPAIPNTKYDWGEVVRNKEENRLQLIFNYKPDDETRNALKHNGFRWSPRFKAWQRMLNSNSEWVLENMIKKGVLS